MQITHINNYEVLLLCSGVHVLFIGLFKSANQPYIMQHLDGVYVLYLRGNVDKVITATFVAVTGCVFLDREDRK